MANTEVIAASCSTSHFNISTAKFHLVPLTTASVICKGVEVPLVSFSAALWPKDYSEKTKQYCDFVPTLTLLQASVNPRTHKI